MIGSFATTVLALAVVLGVLVFVHEAAHFVAAKWAGIYVHRFSLGLGPPIKALTFRRGETEYSVSWLPLGGYVKMASREEEATSAALEGGTPEAVVPPHRMFEAQPVWKRMIVILAGVTANALFAWLLFSVLAFWKGEQVIIETRVGVVADSLPPGAEALRLLRPGDRIVAVAGQPVASWEAVSTGIRDAPGDSIPIRLDDGRTVTLLIHPDALKERTLASIAVIPYRPAIAAEVLPGQPAAQAGVEAGDTIVAIDGQPVRQWYDIMRLIEPRPATRVTLLVGRADGRHTLAVTTRGESVDSGGVKREVGKLGVGSPRPAIRSRSFSLGGAIAEGGRQTVDAIHQVGRTIRGLLSGRVAGRELGGPILIGQLAGQTARLGLDAFLGFMALISVNLALLNLLPVPVLDGGQFMFLLAEAVRGRPLSLRLRERLTLVGLVLIVLLMIFAFWNDIRRLIEAWTQH